MAVIFCDFAAGNDGNTGVNYADVPPGTGPKKTTGSATAGLGADDEVRLLEGPAHSVLVGAGAVTLAWTRGSPTVTSSDDLSVATGTGEVAIGDFIGKSTAGAPGVEETWWEVTNIVTTTITLRSINTKAYTGDTDATAAGCRVLGVIDIDADQNVTASGTSGHPIVISGGWDSATTQNGETWWKRTVHNTGKGIDDNNQAYIKIKDLGILRYLYQAYVRSVAAVGWEFEDVTFSGGSYGVYLQDCDGGNITNYCSVQCNNYGLYMYSSDSRDLQNIYVSNTASAGLYIYSSHDCTLDGVLVQYPMVGIYMQARAERTTMDNITIKEYGNGSGIKLESPRWFTGSNFVGVHSSGVGATFFRVTAGKNVEVDGVTSTMTGTLNNYHTWVENSCDGVTIVGLDLTGGDHGIHITGYPKGVIFSDVLMDTIVTGTYMDVFANPVVVNKYRPTAVTTDVEYNTPASSDPKSDLPILKCQSWKNDDEHRSFYEGQAGGVISTKESDTAQAISGFCTKFVPKDTKFWMRQSFWTGGAKTTAKDLKVSIKEDGGSAFTGAGGIVQAAVYFEEKRITGWTAWVPTTSWVERTVVAAAPDVYQDGLLELRVRIKGTAGNVYMDNFSGV